MEIRELVSDIIHFFYGVTTSIISFFNPTISIFLFIIYIAYQYTQYTCDKDIKSILGDLVEYAAGLIAGSFLIMQNPSKISC